MMNIILMGRLFSELEEVLECSWRIIKLACFTRYLFMLNLNSRV
jgi:hypothetical protein